MQSDGYDETRVWARLPGLDLAMVHRSEAGKGEQVLLALRCAPSFTALGPPVMAPPFLVWIRLMQGLWVACLTGFTAAALPWRDNGR
jgi:hypothetical protein